MALSPFSCAVRFPNRWHTIPGSDADRDASRVPLPTIVRHREIYVQFWPR